MKKTIINQTEAIALLKDKKALSGKKVKFDSTKVEAMDAFLLKKNGIKVPSKLVWYDDGSIDYSDSPEIRDEDLKTGRVKWVERVEVPLHDEIRTWIKKEEIDLSHLLARLITDFYHNVKFVQEPKPKAVSKKKKKEQEKHAKKNSRTAAS